jgi:hypothetical protein
MEELARSQILATPLAAVPLMMPTRIMTADSQSVFSIRTGTPTISLPQTANDSTTLLSLQ